LIIIQAQQIINNSFFEKCVRYRFWHKIYTLRFIIKNNNNLVVIQIMANKILKQYKYNICFSFFIISSIELDYQI
jgi:hypothetical protein